MNWDQLSEDAKTAMRELGNFGPTIDSTKREVKGYMYDDDCGHNVKTYYSSNDLRRFAAGMVEVAAFLDKRAEAKS